MFCSSGSGCASLTRIVNGITTGLPELVVLRAEFGPDIVCASLSGAWCMQARASANSSNALTHRNRRCLIALLFRPSEQGVLYSLTAEMASTHNWRTGEANLHTLRSTHSTGDGCMNQAIGRISAKDLAVARTLKFAPWLVLLITSLPAPVVFLVLFFAATATDSAAIYLLLAGLSLGLGLFLGLLAVIVLALFRRRWLAQLRDRLASDGITASEVVWFRSELTSAERASLSEIKRTNPLLADAYLETLASRLTASRIISKSRRELLKVERRLSRARM